jgi:acyl-CoA synthetase (NDP forming)/RimJ/RimL family protein N-acetyltransferase
VAASDSSYPAHWEADVVLRDGGVVHLRPIRPDDAPAVERFHAGQSAESVYLRFFAPLQRLTARELDRFTQVDHVDRVGLVATLGDDIVGIGRYDRVAEATAEVAFNISDPHQGRGVGSVLLEHLAAAARERGIDRFVADVLPENRKMIAVFGEAGYTVEHHYEDGVLALAFDISPTAESDRVRDAREHRAEARSMHALLHPRSVVVVGAGGDPDSVGQRLLRGLQLAGFTGRLAVVGPGQGQGPGVPRADRVVDLPGPVDLAVVAVPADAVAGVVHDCAAAGVRGLVVVSGGFAETGRPGRDRQHELVRHARAHGMRVVGPNSFGMLNTDPQVRLNASLAPTMAPRGRLGLFSQSGALGIAVLETAARRGLGVSTFVSAGNRADVSGNDLMQYWLDDPATDAVGLYLESMGNPRKFSRVARKLARAKPVIVVKSGQSTFGVPPGHTVRESRLPRQTLDEVLRQGGVIRCENVHQLFDVAQLVIHQPLPAGPRVAVVTNSDALGALAADACVSWGLDVVHGPVAVPAEASAGQFRQALTAAFEAPDVDSVVAGFVPPLVTVDADVALALAEAAAGADKTCVATFLGMHGVTQALSSSARTVPAYPTPEDSVRALVSATRYAQWRRRDPGPRIVLGDARPQDARDLVRRLLWFDDPPGPEGRWLDAHDAGALLAAYGIALWPAHQVSGPDDAAAAAAAIGYPVALKATAQHLRHRVDLGGVRLDIETEDELRRDVEQLRRHGETQFVVQAMAPLGVACVVRSVEDPLFGPVVEFGVGGPPTDLLGDVARRSPPLREADVADLVRGVRAAPLLFGYRGVEPVDVGALEDVVARVSVLADQLPEVAELELNPVVASPQGVTVLGARVRLARPPGRTDSDTRRLPG